MLAGELATLAARAADQKQGHISNCQPIGLSQRASWACGHKGRGKTRYNPVARGRIGNAGIRV
jgi:hypothetical protein